jgi:cell division protein FtsL
MTGRRVRNNRKRGMFGKVSLFLYLGFSLFATIWLRSAVVNLEYELGDLDRMRAELQIEEKMVAAHRASFFSMRNVEKVATRRLGMRQAERSNIFFVKRAPVAGLHMASMR